MELTKQQKKVIEIVQKGGTEKDLIVFQYIQELEKQLEEVRAMWDGVKLKGNEVELKQTREVRMIEEKGLQDIITGLTQQIVKIQKGDKGEMGTDGYSPVKGQDYFTNEELREIKEEIRPKKGVDYRDGMDGKDADEKLITENAANIAFDMVKEILPEMKKEIRDALELLKGKDRLEMSAIKGLRSALRKKDKQLGGGVSSIVPMKMDIETPSGSINGSNAEFTVQWKPQWLTLNGQAIYEDNGYTLTSVAGVLTITLDTAPATGMILRSHYTYN